MSADADNPESSFIEQLKAIAININYGVVLAGLIVFVIWFVATYVPHGYGLGLARENLDARVGAVSGLFSGLALIFVVIAIYQQREELRLQRQELADTRKELKRSAEAQEQNAEQFRAASRRQSREQFLTARLNAQIALHNVQQALFEEPDVKYFPLGAAGADAYAKKIRTLKHRKIKIELLSFETEQGFEGEWSHNIERESIRLWMVGCAKWLVSRFDLLPEDAKPTIERDINTACENVEILISVIHSSYPDIIPTLKTFVDNLRRSSDDPKPMIEWCRVANEVGFVSGQFPWFHQFASSGTTPTSAAQPES